MAGCICDEDNIASFCLPVLLESTLEASSDVFWAIVTTISLQFCNEFLGNVRVLSEG